MSLQSENLWGISRLDGIAFRLPGITCYDAKVCTSNSEDGTTVLSVWVEVSLKGVKVCSRMVMGHDSSKVQS